MNTNFMMIRMTNKREMEKVIHLLEKARSILKGRRQYRKAKEVERTIIQYREQKLTMPK